MSSWVFRNGDLVEVDNLEKCFESIRETVEGKDTRIKYLEKQNKELLDEAYKDNKLKEMQDELERMRADYRRGFPITEAEEKAIEKWCNKHDEKVHKLKTNKDKMKAGGCIGGSFTYCFICTSIGTLGYVKCHCGKEFTFRDL